MPVHIASKVIDKKAGCQNIVNSTSDLFPLKNTSHFMANQRRVKVVEVMQPPSPPLTLPPTVNPHKFNNFTFEKNKTKKTWFFSLEGWCKTLARKQKKYPNPHSPQKKPTSLKKQMISSGKTTNKHKCTHILRAGYVLSGTRLGLGPPWANLYVQLESLKIISQWVCAGNSIVCAEGLYPPPPQKKGSTSSKM